MVAKLKPLFGLVIFLAAGQSEKALTVRPIDFPFVHFSMWVFTVFRETPYGQGSLEVPTARNITSGAPDLAYMQKLSPG